MGKSALEIYCQDASAYPLLTAEEEQLLAQDPTEEAKLKLVTSNLRLVIKIARDCGHYNMLTDLIAEGNTGLIEAAQRYESKGIRFATYARWWILQRMYRYISSNSCSVRVPQQFRIKAAKFTTMQGKTDDEIKKTFNIGERGLKNLKTFKIGADTSIDDLKGLPDNSCTSHTLKLQKYLKTIISEELDEQEQDILYRNLGLFGVRKETLRELGADLNLSAERIRQLRALAVRKLRTRLVLTDGLDASILREYK